ncbi:tetratricopeptide repeat protein [Nocardiopsis sp. Huas11]|uniref:tetratricopeptide repeat protein n=1 Tax=Nocardiopsis sp. Huas11 TaxID=2183912 RepID=UPI000F163A58|nr:tetratricopeptide repeat protein [Nocardiopsis sp. Huas11]RKS05049.1 tetratricopeptide repeat protein [Nocardiopsis sp. Huas11]
MDADDLDRRVRIMRGLVPTPLVLLLIERGHLDEVRRQAARGQWFCAVEWARTLGGRGDGDAALEVLRPFTDTGWWEAARTAADLAQQWGRESEALALVAPFAREGDPVALGYTARLLARQGRGDEGFAMLRPHAGDPRLARALVEVAAGLGRDDEVAALLEAALTRPDAPGDPAPLAAVYERQGRIDAAEALLRSTRTGVVSDVDALVDLLFRQGRHDDVRALVLGQAGSWAAHRLAGHLERAGDVDGAADVLRPFTGPVSWAALRPRVVLAQMLRRHGRADECLDLLRPLPQLVVPDGEDTATVIEELGTLLNDQGRPEEALAVVDDLVRRDGGMSEELFEQRVMLLCHAGRVGQALAETRARAEAGEPDAPDTAWYLASALERAGRYAEAIGVIREAGDAWWDKSVTARLLLLQGRVREAVDLLTQDPVPLGTGEA